MGIADGDTISVMHDGQAEKIRLNGMDCLEKGQPFGKRVKQFASDLAFQVLPQAKRSDDSDKILSSSEVVGHYLEEGMKCRAHLSHNRLISNGFRI